MIPYLELLQKRTLDFAEKHSLSWRQAALLLLEDEQVESSDLGMRHFDHPSYVYLVDQFGVREVKERFRACKTVDEIIRLEKFEETHPWKR